jgi:hypothetical protein
MQKEGVTATCRSLENTLWFLLVYLVFDKVQSPRAIPNLLRLFGLLAPSIFSPTDPHSLIVSLLLFPVSWPMLVPGSARVAGPVTWMQWSLFLA